MPLLLLLDLQVLFLLAAFFCCSFPSAAFHGGCSSSFRFNGNFFSDLLPFSAAALSSAAFLSAAALAAFSSAAFLSASTFLLLLSYLQVLFLLLLFSLLQLSLLLLFSAAALAFFCCSFHFCCFFSLLQLSLLLLFFSRGFSFLLLLFLSNFRFSGSFFVCSLIRSCFSCLLPQLLSYQLQLFLLLSYLN